MLPVGSAKPALLFLSSGCRPIKSPSSDVDGFLIRQLVPIVATGRKQESNTATVFLVLISLYVSGILGARSQEAGLAQLLSG
jgi:hypothetical protein